MNKKRYSIIIILYTVFNIVVLVKFNIDEDLKEKRAYESQYMDKNITENLQEDEQGEVPNKDVTSTEAIDDMDESCDEKTKQDVIDNLNKNRKNIDTEKENQLNRDYESDAEIGNINDLDLEKYNKEVSEKYHVMKASPNEIMDELTLAEKTKVMLICKELTKKDYSDITEFLTYKDERLGVMRTLNVLEKRVKKEKVEELKGIFSKYIDLDKVEGEW